MDGSNERYGAGQASSGIARDIQNPPDQLDSALTDSLNVHTKTETTQQYRDEESSATKVHVEDKSRVLKKTEMKKTPTTTSTTTRTSRSKKEAKSEEDEATTKIMEIGSEKAGLEILPPTEEECIAGAVQVAGCAKTPPVATLGEEIAAKEAARRSMDSTSGAGRAQVTDCSKVENDIDATNYANPQHIQTPRYCTAQSAPRASGTPDFYMEQGKCAAEPLPVAPSATCEQQAAQSPHTISPLAMVPNQPGYAPTNHQDLMDDLLEGLAPIPVAPSTLRRDRQQARPGAYRGENLQRVQSLDFELQTPILSHILL
ncbi:expressed unknown protein [Seminavis robusta]|uniref:Uncharacterized protein n=1 Tax=Seminavis robusta TaxID=568900 RepID=A0A9N8EL15_9STRA|nr:expressed unknown protein [Seminavis robusta]|eukprot:Sro1261_g257000.1 n/a (315) ;mRNA; f:7650-8661